MVMVQPKMSDGTPSEGVNLAAARYDAASPGLFRTKTCAAPVSSGAPPAGFSLFAPATSVEARRSARRSCHGRSLRALDSSESRWYSPSPTAGFRNNVRRPVVNATGPHVRSSGGNRPAVAADRNGGAEAAAVVDTALRRWRKPGVFDLNRERSPAAGGPQEDVGCTAGGAHLKRTVPALPRRSPCRRG